jgi:hypothetical protein
MQLQRYRETITEAIAKPIDMGARASRLHVPEKCGRYARVPGKAGKFCDYLKGTKEGK